MSSYWLGVATVPALIAALWLALLVLDWCRWWFIHNGPDFHGGKGATHDLQSSRSGRWAQVRHTHWWPPGTPWWLVHAAEPARIWLCLRDSHHRAIQLKEKS